MNIISISLLEKYNTQMRLTKSLVKRAHKESWERYVSSIENDVHGQENAAYKITKHLNSRQSVTAKKEGLDWVL